MNMQFHFDRPALPAHPRPHFTPQQIFLFLLLSLLLLSELLGNWALLVVSPAYAASMSTRPSPPAGMTFQQFLKQGHHNSGIPILHAHNVQPPGSPKGHSTDYGHLPPSAEPAKMQPIIQPLSKAFLTGGKGVPSLDLLGSDKRLEVQIQPGSLDLSHATVPSGGPPVGAVTLHLTQLHGHYVGQVNLLGSYQLQLLDSRAQVISGIQLRTPVTFVYHYQLAEINALQLDPGNLVMTWPVLIGQALQAHQPTTGLSIAMQNDPVKHTLTAVSHVIAPSPFDPGGGSPQNQSPPTMHLASVQGNAGQLTYSYPLQVPPGTGGFGPQLSLNYSSSDPNQRHSANSPANNVGDGWTLSLGSISADVYANTQQIWYFLSGVANAGDRLIPGGSFYDTQHLSYLRIQQVTSGQTGQPCFKIWAKDGTYYEVGCTNDSLQYWTDDNNTRHNYRWDVNKIIAPNEGPTSSTYKLLTVSYLQDSVTDNGHTSIRDAAIKQIIYGSGGTNSVTTVAGMVDFFYMAPFNQSPWASAYGTNYNCNSTPPENTTLRCDDPITYGTIKPPKVMSTLSLQTVTSYVGTDGGNEAYSYSLSYSGAQKDTPFSSCYDPYSLIEEYCAGEHLLQSITPTVYQSNNGHALRAVTFGYTPPTLNNYIDTLHFALDGKTQYGGQTN